MIHPYMTLADETEIVHTHLLKDGDINRVEVHFERPKYMGFDTARCSLPDYKWIIRDGFTNEEITFFLFFLRHNAHLIFRYAENGGSRLA